MLEDPEAPALPQPGSVRRLRCGHCGGDLGELARHRPLRVAPQSGIGRQHLLVEVVFCSGCGTVITTAPAGGTGPATTPSEEADRSGPTGGTETGHHRVLADLPATAPAPGPQPVELFFERTTGLLSGRVGDDVWEAECDLDGPHGWARGRFGAREASITWYVGGPGAVVRSARVNGHFGRDAIKLEGLFGPETARLAGAPVEGLLCGASLRAGVSVTGDGTGAAPGTIVARGDLGGADFEIFASPGPGKASVRGTLGLRPLALDLVSREGRVSITGSYAGDTAFLALLVGAALLSV